MNYNNIVNKGEIFMKKGFTKTAALMLVAALVVTSITVTRKPVTTYADNPVVQTYFTADPAPLVVGDTMYLITSHDEDVLEKNKPTDDYKFFTMKNWKCYSTKDMVNWTDHGTIFGQSSFEWGHTWCFRAWAAQCVERDGKFYLYVPILRKNTTEEGESPGYGIGVAVADNPYGPYEDAIGAPLIEGDWNDIDPTVFVDDDGQAYLFYGQTLKYALLNDDMISLKTQPVQFNVPNYVEGPWFTKHNGTYYFMWAGRGGNTSAHKGGETLHYAYCDEPLGNYTYGGLLQETTRGASFTNHPGVADFKGESYLFYHTDELPSGVGEDSGPHRSVCVDKFTYNDDGTIDPVSMTDGVEPVDTLNPYNRTEAETIAWGLGLKTAGTVNDKGYNDMYVYNMHNEDYIDVRNVDFGIEGAVKFTASVKDAKADADASIEIYLDENDYIGTVKADNYTDAWKEISVDLNKKVTGIHDVRFVFKGNYQKPENETGLREDKDAYIHEEDTGMFKFDYWQFSGEVKDTPVQNVTDNNVNQTTQPSPSVPAEKTKSLSKVKKVIVKRNNSKKVTVSWKKVTGAEKYEIRYTADKKFKKGVKKVVVKKTKATIKIPKSKKTCYLKIRATAKGSKPGKYSEVKKFK